MKEKKNLLKLRCWS